jgi:hypothetical protein
MSLATRKRSGRWSPTKVGLMIVLPISVLVPLATFGYALLATKWAGQDGSIPRLTRAAFEDAKRKWKASGIENYNLDLRFSGGDQQTIVHIEVCNGEVTNCLEDGRPPSQKTYWGDWTIASQLAMIGQDLDKSEDPVSGFRTKSNVVITLFGEFDPEFGYPLAYDRKARGPTPLRSNWRVLEFKPLR